jgi:hypothetical protein
MRNVAVLGLSGLLAACGTVAPLTPPAGVSLPDTPHGALPLLAPRLRKTWICPPPPRRCACTWKPRSVGGVSCTSRPE